MGLVSRNRQTLMFSATMPPEIRRLADAFLTDPKEAGTPPATTADGVEDHVTAVPARDKFQALRRLIETQEVDKALIFCNRKREVASLRRQLERAGLNVRDIHGDLEQSQRTQALDAFKRGEIDFLVATDVAARGLDIVSLPCVINYDVPTHADDYVHRIGRTGRAGQEGRAFTLILPEERRFVDAITRLTGKDIPRLDIPGLEEAANGKPATSGRRTRANGEAATARRGAARNGASRPTGLTAASRADVGRGAPAEPEAPGFNGGRIQRRSSRPAPAEPDPPSARNATTRAAGGQSRTPGAAAARPSGDPGGRHGRSRAAVHAPRGAERGAPAETHRRLMQTIFIMVKCERGRAYEVADAAVQGSSRCRKYSISGQYDLLMKVYLDDQIDIGRFVTSRVTLDGVQDTFTLIAFKAFA